MPSSICSDSKQEIERLFEGSVLKTNEVINSSNQTDEKVENCRKAIDICEPSHQVRKMIGKVSSNISEERQKITDATLQKCKEVLRRQHARRPIVGREVIKDKGIALFAENENSAKESFEVQFKRKSLQEELSIEKEMIKAQLSQKA